MYDKRAEYICLVMHILTGFFLLRVSLKYVVVVIFLEIEDR
jgi:hypothetical protein